MKKYLVISKSANNINWSSSIELQLNEINKEKDFTIEYIDKAREKIRNLDCYSVIYVHHSINFYKFLFLGGAKYINKIVFIPHEGEPLLGWRFALKNRALRNFGSLLRYSKIYNIIPSLLASETLVLSSMQSELYKGSKYLHMLGVDEKIFFADPLVEKDIDVFFPANPSRPEKNYRIVAELIDCKVHVAENVANSKMPTLYQSAKVVIIPSVLETYCLALVEAMLCNCVIVVSRNVGLITDFLNCYSEKELNNAGIFLMDNSFDSLVQSLKLACNFQDTRTATTRDFAIQEKLTSELSAKEFIKHVRR